MKDNALRSLVLATEDAIGHGNMIVDVEVEATAEALGKAHRTAADVGRARPLRFARAPAMRQTARAADARFLARRCDRRRSARPRCVLREAATRRERSVPTAGSARLERRDPSGVRPCCTFFARCMRGKRHAVCTRKRPAFLCDNWSTEHAEAHARGCRKPGRRVGAVRSAAPWLARRSPHSGTSEQRTGHESTSIVLMKPG